MKHPFRKTDGPSRTSGRSLVVAGSLLALLVAALGQGVTAGDTPEELCRR